MALFENRPLETRSIDHVEQRVLDEIERFFVAYNKLEDRKFEIVGQGGPDDAWRLVARSGRKA